MAGLPPLRWLAAADVLAAMASEATVHCGLFESYVDEAAWLAKRLVKDGYAVWVFGSEKEKPLGDAIVEGLGAEAVNLCGRTRLVDAADLLSLAKCAITNDSGLMHVAAAMGVRVIAIYGSSSPEYTPPLTDKADIVYLNLECSPCFERECPLGHLNCLKQITVDTVYKHIQA